MRPFFKSYDDGGSKVPANQAASPCEAVLREGFANPPPDVKIGCYYYWVNERILDDGTRIHFTEQSLFEVVFPDGRTETWNPVSGK